MSQDILERLRNAIVDLDEEAGIAAAKDAKAAKIDPTVAVENGLTVGMGVLSDRFDEGELFVPELLRASKVFSAATAILTEGISAEEKVGSARGKILIHTVQGDIHDIGKNLVATMLDASGFEVIDLGRDVAVEHVVDMAQKENADIIAGSALLTTTMPRMKDTVDLLQELGIRDKFKCMFGGAPVSEEWVMEFADGYAETASGAVKVAIKLMEEKKGG